MELKIIYEHEEMRDMVVHVNSEGLQKIMTILADENNIIVTQLTPHALDGAMGICECNYMAKYPVCTKCGRAFPPRQ
jgi:hypothetical protein